MMFKKLKFQKRQSKKFHFFYFFSFYIISIFCLLTFLSCAIKKPIPFKKQLTLKRTPLPLADDLRLSNFILALKKNIQALKEKKNPFLNFGDRKIQRVTYIKALNYLLDLIQLEKSNLKQESGMIFDFIQKNFDFYAIEREFQSRNKKKTPLKSENVFLTSYYAPLIQGSKTKTKKYSQPLYKTPKNLVQLKINKFKNAFLQTSNYEKNYMKKYQKKDRTRNNRQQESESYLDPGEDSLVPLMGWGRIVKPEKNELALDSIVPFYSREEIDVQNKILSKDLVLAWVDPLDAFFLHIQGSGTVEFKDGKRLNLGYHSQNGFPYVPIGKYVNLPKEEVTMGRIIKHLLSLSDKERQDFLNLNPSYVFFQKLKNKKSITFFGTEAVAGRTIATDMKFFPKGALAYLEFKKPLFSEDKNPLNLKEWKKVSRFVMDQDIGGAIRGAHRADLFWGEGNRAGLHAGVMKDWGKLYYLAPKESFLNILSEGKK